MLTKSLRFTLTTVMFVYAVGLIGYLVLRLVLADTRWWLAFAHNFAPFYFVPLILFLPLALLLRVNARLSIVMLILLVIGALWFAPRFVPRSVAHAATDTLKVITFNVWGNNRRLDDMQSWLHEQNADLVLFQEIPPAWSGVGIPPLEDLYPYQVSQSADVRAWGQLTLSRYPILEAEDFDLEGDGTGSHQRVVIDANGTEIAVYNIHTNMPTRDRPRFRLPINHFSIELVARYDETARNAQLRALFDRLASEPLPYIAGGDFNTSDNSIMYGEMASLMSDSYREATIGLGGTWPTGALAGLPNWLPPVLRIDYVWHSGGFYATGAATGPVLGSDHVPVIVTLAFDGG